VLSQGTTGKDLPVAYANRVLTTPEKNYSTIERELTAIVWAYKQFRPYIWGRRFTIVTDHKPLTSSFRMTDPSSRIMRLKLKLEEFDYTIVYKKGNKILMVMDYLSRMYTGTEEHMSKCIRVVTEEKGDTVEEQEVKDKELSSKEKIGNFVRMNRTYKR
jgi:hypothetical protein